MIEQVSNSLTLRAFYVASGVGATGLTVTVDVYDPAGSKIVTGASATELGDGIYEYTLASSATTSVGEYTYVFKTTGTADQKHLAGQFTVGRAGVEYLDATISSRLPTSSYTAPPSSASIADAVWDETTAGHQTAGTTGKALTDAANLSASAAITLVSPVAQTGDISIVKGDDYSAIDSRALQWSDSGSTWPDLTGASIVLTIDDVRLTTASFAGAIVDANTVRVELTSTQTSTFFAGAQRYYLRAILPAGHVVTLATGSIVVDDPGSITAAVTTPPPRNPTWSEIIESPTGVSHALMRVSTNCVVGGYLYAAKGRDGSGYRNDAHRFDIANNAWEALATDTSGVSCRDSAVAMHDGLLYVIGGAATTGTIDAVRIYNTATDTWTGGATMLAARSRAACALDEARGDIYVCGGQDAAGTWVADVYRYDIVNDNWSQSSGLSGAIIPDLPVAAGLGAAFVYGNTLYVFPAWNGSIKSTMYKLDLASTSPSWVAAGTHPSPTENMSALAYSDSLYLYGGYSGSAWLNQGYRYDAATETFTELTPQLANGIASGWMGHSDGKMYAGAGRDTTATYRQDVQVGT